MPLPPALSELKLKLIQCRVFEIVVRDRGGVESEILLGGFFYQVKGTKSMKLEQK